MYCYIKKITRITFLIFKVWLTVLLYSQIAHSSELGISTGSTNGTYIAIANDIANLLTLKQASVNLTVFESNGSLDNIDAVIDNDNVNLGIVQSDVLSFIQSSKIRKLEQIASKLKMIFPLYNEEVHLLAKKNITSIHDLKNKLVAIGPTGSGTHLTSQLIFKASDTWPLRKINIQGKEALTALQAGEIDAMFYVSGYPVKLFTQIEENANFHLVPIKDKGIKEIYRASTIPANTYPWQKSAIDTIRVKALLMSYDFKSKHCEDIKQLTSTVYNNIDWLKQNGHPKWKNVDLDYKLSRWELYECVAELFPTANNIQDIDLKNTIVELSK